MKKLTTPNRPHPRFQTKIEGPSMTKQSFKDECNINKIMEKFIKTGVIDHYAKYAPTYGDATSVELADALQVVATADEMFMELPSQIRQKFANDPGQFLDFVQNPENKEEMIKLGLRQDNRAKVRASMSERSGDTSPEPAQSQTPAE